MSNKLKDFCIKTANVCEKKFKDIINLDFDSNKEVQEMQLKLFRKISEQTLPDRNNSDGYLYQNLFYFKINNKLVPIIVEANDFNYYSENDLIDLIEIKHFKIKDGIKSVKKVEYELSYKVWDIYYDLIKILRNSGEYERVEYKFFLDDVEIDIELKKKMDYDVCYLCDYTTKKKILALTPMNFINLKIELKEKEVRFYIKENSILTIR